MTMHNADHFLTLFSFKEGEISQFWVGTECQKCLIPALELKPLLSFCPVLLFRKKIL